MKRILLKSLFLSAVVAAFTYFYATLPDVKGLETKNPRSTALMELRDREYNQKGMRSSGRHIWLSYDAISEHLKKAVLISEDASFFSHAGVDVKEMQEALKKDWETSSFARGGSTITMQLARNLYLDPAKNPLRKAREIVIAWQLERALSKRRIFEIYLNVVEWGRNIYGAESAARHYFAKSAANLDIVEAATLAALLPSPRNVREKNLADRRNLILSRMARVGYVSGQELSRASQAPLFKK
jgi:monofunctional biosynthetic peptidoglycan transglycosylase